MSLASSPGLFCSIKAIACVSRLLITKKKMKSQGQKDSGTLNGEAEDFPSKNDFSLGGFLPSNSGMIYVLRHGRLSLSEEKFQHLYIGTHDNNWESHSQDGSIPDESLFDTLQKDENDGYETNPEDLHLVLM